MNCARRKGGRLAVGKSDPSGRDPTVHPEKVREALRRGELKELAAYLREGDGPLDPGLRKHLATLIDGNATETGLRLKLGRHPDLARTQPGIEKKLARSREEYLIAFFVAQTGGCEPRTVTAAISLAAEMLGCSVSKVEKIWARLREPATLRSEALSTLRDQSLIS